LLFCTFTLSLLLTSCAEPPGGTTLRFEISFPESVSSEPLTGRMLLCFASNNEREPRLQNSKFGPQFFGVDFENLSPGEKAVIDGATLGYPVHQLKNFPAGEYYIQAVLNRYTRFERSDGHTVWMHNDQWEGQNWRRSPGNIYSDVKKVAIDPSSRGNVTLSVTNVIPPVELPEDTKWVKRFKFESKLLSNFWGQPIYLGATVLLPKGYDDHPDISYPAVYQQGHFSLRAPFRFVEDDGNEFYREWKSDNFPRLIAITLQHPTPYFDDSYAVNSVNNGPYGDAIHQELIPEIERRFRCISKGYARVLTGGSTGGWESLALQIFHPDFYGGTWTFSPDPIDFRNVEGINIYQDVNAFYKQHEWYRVPISNTRFTNGEVRQTSQQKNYVELVGGANGRSGGQLDIWSAVYGPVGQNGYFEPLFDKRAGNMNPHVAVYWRENYDLRYILEKNWATLGPRLVGKLHLYAGRMDNYYLNEGVYYMEEFLEKTTDPYYAGSFTYGARGGHGWRPFSNQELLRTMSGHITKNSPAGENTSQWKY